MKVEEIKIGDIKNLLQEYKKLLNFYQNVNSIITKKKNI